MAIEWNHAKCTDHGCSWIPKKEKQHEWKLVSPEFFTTEAKQKSCIFKGKGCIGIGCCGGFYFSLPADPIHRQAWYDALKILKPNEKWAEQKITR